ncbi:heterokaryon incompatibility protein [Rutstroemia sp. NJR-2017a BVV2]|nr:heterokaryon incompatibility protein [Rutstroemia sp. NJR-2017a BVV2]PQE21854.1 heterokaryon incompatibility protein [Rutstroemia sp. NJR-2017a BVV2]
MQDLLSYEIRMIVIHDATDNGQLQCTLEYISLIDPGPYSALSYCWGGQADKKHIIVDGSPVGVGANLEAALKQLQLHGYKRIWADALCINQSDLEERGLQVRNMQQIYSKAKNVIAWIGNDEKNIAAAVVYFLKNRMFEWLPSRRRTAFLGFKEPSLGFGVEPSIAKQWEQQRWRIFEDFFNLDYWRRVWVIQELASGSDIKIIFGNTKISWQSILDAVTFLGEHTAEISEVCRSSQNIAQLHRFRSRFLSNSQGPITLYEALQWSHYALATDPRDKIYALLGLTSDGHKIIPLPNYQQSLAQIHENMTKAMFVLEKSLDSICLRGLDCCDDRQPSWEDRKLRERKPQIGVPIFDTQESGILRTKGDVLGSVCALSSYISTTREAGEPSAQKIEVDGKDELALAISHNLQSNYPSGIANAIAQNLCSSQLIRNFSTTEDCFYNLWKPETQKALQGLPLLRWLDDNSSLKIGSLSLQDWAQSESKRSRLKKSLSLWHSSYHSSDQGRYTDMMSEIFLGSMRLMVTQTGFIGLAPSATQTGDIICYIRGCSEPVVLRKRESSVTDDSYPKYQLLMYKLTRVSLEIQGLIHGLINILVEAVDGFFSPRSFSYSNRMLQPVKA